jgi:hypothetical protein
MPGDKYPRKKRRKTDRKPLLSKEVVLAWADDHRERTGELPGVYSGPVYAAPAETWLNVDQCLRQGHRGFPGGSSLAKLLTEERGRRNRSRPPKLPEDQIAAWAKKHHRKTGEWPTQHSGPVVGQPGEDWSNVSTAMIEGRRGLPEGGSLPGLIASRFGVRNRAALPPYNEEAILSWLDEHHARTGRWPGIKAGEVAACPGETWSAVDDALRRGGRGLPGGSSIIKLLVEGRGVTHPLSPPPLTEAIILTWADDHHVRTGEWPGKDSGPLVASPGETWCGIDNALEKGRRGLPGGDSVAALLARHGRKTYRGRRAGG